MTIDRLASGHVLPPRARGAGHFFLSLSALLAASWLLGGCVYAPRHVIDEFRLDPPEPVERAQPAGAARTMKGDVQDCPAMTVARYLVLLTACLQAACASTNLAEFRTVEIYRGSEITAEIAVDSPATDPSALTAQMRSGQVIVREAGTSMAFLMNLMAADYAPFGHAGIVVKEADGFYVYDAFSQLDPLFWKPPTRRLRGKIRRTKLETFLQRGTVSAVYEHRDVDLESVAAYARGAFRDRLAFDGLFDYRTPERVYCSEFVAAALLSAGHDATPATPRTENPSLDRIMHWLELDTPGFILSARLVAGATEIARLSPTLSPPQIEAHFAFERELHRQFTADQKLAQLFRWTLLGPGSGLNLRSCTQR